jgi:hypothetical protein
MLKYRIKKSIQVNDEVTYCCYRKKFIFWVPLGCDLGTYIASSIFEGSNSCEDYKNKSSNKCIAIDMCKKDANEYFNLIKYNKEKKIIKTSHLDFSITDDGVILGDIKND